MFKIVFIYLNLHSIILKYALGLFFVKKFKVKLGPLFFLKNTNKILKKKVCKFFIQNSGSYFFVNKFKKILINQFLYSFNFLDDVNHYFSNTAAFKKKFFFFFITLHSLSYKNFFLRTSNIKKKFLYKDLKKNLIYKISNSRKMLINFLFFIKTKNKLSIFIKTNKNLNFTFFFNIFFLKNFFFNFFNFLNKKMYLFFLKKKFIYVNKFCVTSYFFFLSKNDVISFFMGEAALKYVIISLYKAKFKFINFLKSHFKQFFFFNFEFFFLTLTFIYLGLKSHINNYGNFNRLCNFSNIRTYNWLVSF